MTVEVMENVFDRSFILYLDTHKYPNKCEGFFINVTYNIYNASSVKHLGIFPFQDDGPEGKDIYICPFYPIWDFEY